MLNLIWVCVNNIWHKNVGFVAIRMKVSVDYIEVVTNFFVA